ncbi:MAG: hypothetical protein J6J01_10975, partial [Oscillospiraceae bacterium]|nr:hypothetical protein [Oscillospiraceae bacterium]
GLLALRRAACKRSIDIDTPLKIHIFSIYHSTIFRSIWQLRRGCFFAVSWANSNHHIFTRRNKK